MRPFEIARRDIRESSLYREAEALYSSLFQPGTGQLSDATDVHVSPGGTHVVFTGTLVEKLEGVPTTRICQVELRSGQVRVLTFGPNQDRLPRYSPNGQHIAFLSDRHKSGDFQLYLLDPHTGAARRTPRVEGWVEYLHWSPDGRRILLGVAGHGADVAGGQGAIASQQGGNSVPSWMPEVDTGDENYRWRRAWTYELATHAVRQVSEPDANIWEVAWCGNEAVVAVVSAGPSEGLWYTARLRLLLLAQGDSVEILEPQDQLGWPSCSSDGKYVAVVEALCSDRWFVAGNLRVIDTDSGKCRAVDTAGIDVSYTEWRSERRLLVAGHRGFETVVGVYDVDTARYQTVWGSEDISTGGFYVSVSGFNDSGDCVLVGEGFTRAPEIAVIEQGRYRAIRSFDIEYSREARVVSAAERMSWSAPDGLNIQGWLLRPEGEGPYPVVMCVHGGPVGHWRPMWLGRRPLLLLLIKRGYAVFLPNPRGSSGRGQDFVRHVLGDMGGADTYDYLSGIDHLVQQGIAERGRIGVTGVSYGGFITSWLITQDSRFAAAVPVSPVTNHVTEHLISNIPEFVSLFLADSYTNAGGKYYQRSPVMHAYKVRTPTLNICGLLDRCTPPEEAMQFHNALMENGIESVLVTYPEEGHGIRKLPASIDCASRVVSWFTKHMSTQPGNS